MHWSLPATLSYNTIKVSHNRRKMCGNEGIELIKFARMLRALRSASASEYPDQTT